jgi:hypothetical protein
MVTRLYILFVSSCTVKKDFSVARATNASLNRKSTKRRNEKILRLIGEFRAAKNQRERIKYKRERTEYKKRKIEKKQEIFQLERQLALQAVGEPETGALPDFVIFGAKKAGTTSFYDLLTQHPHVEPGALKGTYYFNDCYDESIEWYRRCFPSPRWKDGRRSLTGEATPKYILHPLVPERMVKVLPQVRLIVLLRNPIDRAYSDYQQQVVKERKETRTFEEAIGAEERRLFEKEGKTSGHEERVNLNDVIYTQYLSRGIYADQLPPWSKVFGDEQILMLKSEDFFEHTRDTLKLALKFLDLPDWEPEAWKIRNKGKYEQKMDPATRRHLEDFFEPHNRRLYEYLGVDFGW